jgi:voltage-gated potassium channel
MTANPDSAATRSERLRRWNRAFNPFVVVAAVLPLGVVIAGEDPTEGPGALLAFGCWLVFVIDFAARRWLDDQFLSSWKGRLYLGIVVVTFPIYLLVPSLEEADVLALTRLGWVAVLAVAGLETAREAPRMVRRVGVTGLYATAAVFVAATVVNRVEDAENGFRNFGDALWWAIATITTVGYGDRVPVTTTGRVIATLLMISGLAFLGVIAASLAAYYGLSDSQRQTDDSDSEDPRLDQLIEEVQRLSKEVARNRADGERDSPASESDTT